jgi:hypothetical protein
MKKIPGEIRYGALGGFIISAGFPGGLDIYAI